MPPINERLHGTVSVFLKEHETIKHDLICILDVFGRFATLEMNIDLVELAAKVSRVAAELA
ncbi:hypothetical protein [Brevibacillus sp. BC25]|uniref:hypothetical protein n=1 Tax=Brevibacillus sp. BC25 TaxID=1144308 RepID=UPI0002D39E11|nr:hypothetical protein [Brevibacillus sp. BC25]